MTVDTVWCGLLTGLQEIWDSFRLMNIARRLVEAKHRDPQLPGLGPVSLLYLVAA